MEINEIDYKSPIRNYFKEESIFICLFPFYKKVFSDNYNWEANLKVTYPIIETLTWKEVSIKTGFNQLKRVALGILDLKEPFKTELKQFCQHDKLEPPNYCSDKIPEVITVPIIEYLKEQEYTTIQMKPFERFAFNVMGDVLLSGRNVFDIYEDIKEAKFLHTENSIGLTLPDYDCPYALLFGEKTACKKLIDKANLETFDVNNETTFHWWND